MGAVHRLRHASGKRFSPHTSVEFNVDVLCGSLKFDDDIGSMAFMQLVEEEFLSLMEEARLHMGDFKGLTLGCIETKRCEFPCIRQNVNTHNHHPIPIGFCKPGVNLPNSKGHAFSPVFHTFLPPSVHAFTPLKLRHGLEDVGEVGTCFLHTRLSAVKAGCVPS